MSEEQKNNIPERNRGRYIGMGIGLGLVFGSVLGFFSHNMLSGILIGAGGGFLVGFILEQRRKKY